VYLRVKTEQRLDGIEPIMADTKKKVFERLDSCEQPANNNNEAAWIVDISDVIVVKKQQGRRLEEMQDDGGPPTLGRLGSLPLEQSTVDKTASSNENKDDNSDVADAKEWRKFIGDSSSHRSSNIESISETENNILNSGVSRDNPPVDQAVTVCQEQALDVDQTADQEQQGKFAAIIPEAFLVEEDDHDQRIVISGHAEPLILIPWWKETRLKVLIGLIVVAVLSIILGLTLSSYNTKTVTDVQVVIQSVIASESPSVSLQPSSSPSNIPSMEPSSSSWPSPFPTTLLQKLENQQVASDGNNMVMINQDRGIMLVLIYTLNADGRMIPISSFSEEDYGDEFTVSIKDNTTIVDYPKECYGYGAQIVYRQDSSSNKWVKVQDFECPEPEMVEEEHGHDEHDYSGHDHSEEHHSDEDADDMRPPFEAAEDSSKSSSGSISKVNIIVSTCIMTVYLITK